MNLWLTRWDAGEGAVGLSATGWPSRARAGASAWKSSPPHRPVPRGAGRLAPRRSEGAQAHVGQRGAVQDLEIRLQRIVENMLQPAVGRQAAQIGAGVETFDETEIGLRSPHHVADADGPGLLQQPQAAAMPARGHDQTLVCQVVDHLHEVALRNAMMIGQFADRDQAIAVRRAVHEYAQGVVGVLRESHGWAGRKMHAVYCFHVCLSLTYITRESFQHPCPQASASTR